jgi:predicted nuclease of predicted toxin-antitoxin system
MCAEESGWLRLDGRLDLPLSARLRPKVGWLDVENAGTNQVTELLRENRDRIQAFEEQEESSFLILSLSSLSV